MADRCVDENTANEHLNNGLRILARIVVRDFMAKQTLKRDGKDADSNNGNIQNK